MPPIATSLALLRRAPPPRAEAPAGPPALARDRAGAADATLMAWAAAGDRLAFDEIVGRHAERVLQVALGVLQNAAEAEEVAQEALLRAWTHAGGFDAERARFSTWLHRIVLNLAIDRLRRRGGVVPAPLEQAMELRDPGLDPERRAIAAEERVALAGALAALPARQRAAISLVCGAEMPSAEAAASLGVSLRGLEGLLRRARQALRARLMGGAA